MTTTPRRPATAHRISGPGELVQAVPYLLGFHPSRSLVLVGLRAGELVVTARLDLADADVADGGSAALAHTVAAMRRGGASEFVVAIYDDRGDVDRAALPWCALVAAVGAESERAGAELVDALLVAQGRWWSYRCADVDCCPGGGRAVPAVPSEFAAAATYAGVVALPDRGALAAVLDPHPDGDRNALHPMIAAAENAAVAAVLEGRSERLARAVKRSIFAAARESADPVWTGPPDDVATRFAVALGETAVRDAVWMAVDDGRIDGRALWRDLARRLPAPYDAPALFLFGWATWRAGDGALAGIAAERAVASDPDYSAADLLLAALTQGVDPRRLPKLRLPRSA